MNKMIITINRECGSGGGEIARLLGKKFGFKVYGRNELEAVAKRFGITLEELDRIKAEKPNWWDEFCSFYQQFGAAGYKPGGMFITLKHVFCKTWPKRKVVLL